jgi:Tfp pilus assembly protein PilP
MNPERRTSALPVAALSPDPAHWPLDQVRVAGVWQQAQGAQLILTAGPHWVRARVGQRIGPDGHVVQGIHAEEVHLRAAQGPVWVIGLEKAKP